MKTRKICLGVLMVLVFSVCLPLTAAQAQSPDFSGWVGKLFKLNVRTTGVHWIDDGTKIKNENQNEVVLLYIKNLSSPSELKVKIWQQNSEGGWDVFADDHSVTILGGTDLDFLCVTTFEQGGIFGHFMGFVARVTGRLTRGELKSATFKSLGGYSWELSAVGADLIPEVFASGVSINGSFADPSKFPFVP